MRRPKMRVTDYEYAGSDVSDKTTHICVVDDDGAVLRRDVVASDTDALARWVKRHCPGLVRVVLELRRITVTRAITPYLILAKIVKL